MAGRNFLDTPEFVQRFPDAVPVVVEGDFDKIGASERWVLEHTEGLYCARINVAGDLWRLTIRFADPNEGFAFKMRWG